MLAAFHNLSRAATSASTGWLVVQAAWTQRTPVAGGDAEAGRAAADAAHARAGFEPVPELLPFKRCPAGTCEALLVDVGERRLMASASLRGALPWSAPAAVDAGASGKALPLPAAARAVDRALRRYAGLFPQPRGPRPIDRDTRAAACPQGLQSAVASGGADLLLADGPDFRALAGVDARRTLVLLPERGAVLVNPRHFLRKDRPLPRAAAVRDLLAAFVHGQAVDLLDGLGSLAGVPRDTLLHALHAHVMGEPLAQVPASAPQARERLAQLDLGALLQGLHDGDAGGMVRAILPPGFSERLAATSLLPAAGAHQADAAGSPSREAALGGLEAAVVDLLSHEPPRSTLAMQLARLLGPATRQVARDCAGAEPPAEALRRLAVAHGLLQANDAVRSALPASIGRFDAMADADLVLNFVDGDERYAQAPHAPEACGDTGPLAERGNLALVNALPWSVTYEMHGGLQALPSGGGHGGLDGLVRALAQQAKAEGGRPAGRRECLIIHVGLDNELDTTGRGRVTMRALARMVAMAYLGPSAEMAARHVAALQDDAPPVGGLMAGYLADQLFARDLGRPGAAIALVGHVIGQRARAAGQSDAAALQEILALLFQEDSFHGAANVQALARLHGEFAAQAGAMSRAWTVRPAAGSPSAARAGAS